MRVRPDDLPAILLGRLPEPTAGEIGGERIGEVSHVDQEGRTWRVVFDERGLARWRLEHDGEPLVWHREDRGGRLELGSPAVEVRWKEVARETLRATAPDPADAASSQPSHSGAVSAPSTAILPSRTRPTMSRLTIATVSSSGNRGSWT